MAECVQDPGPQGGYLCLIPTTPEDSERLAGGAGGGDGGKALDGLRQQPDLLRDVQTGLLQDRKAGKIALVGQLPGLESGLTEDPAVVRRPSGGHREPAQARPAQHLQLGGRKPLFSSPGPGGQKQGDKLGG